MDTGTVRALPVARHLAIDEQGTLLRATWRPEHGFVNLSLWRGDTCAETFHLAPHEAAGLMSFLAGALADAATAPPPLRVVPGQAAATPRPGQPRRRRWAITSLTNWSGWRRRRRPE